MATEEESGAKRMQGRIPELPTHVVHSVLQQVTRDVAPAVASRRPDGMLIPFAKTGANVCRRRRATPLFIRRVEVLHIASVPVAAGIELQAQAAGRQIDLILKQK